MKEKKVLRSLTMVSQIGISMMVPIFICGAIGYWLNHQFNKEIIFPILLIIGIGAAFRNLFLLTKSFYQKDLTKEHERNAYLEGLKNYQKEHPDEDFSDVMEGKKKRYSDLKGPARK